MVPTGIGGLLGMTLGQLISVVFRLVLPSSRAPAFFTYLSRGEQRSCLIIRFRKEPERGSSRREHHSRSTAGKKESARVRHTGSAERRAFTPTSERGGFRSGAHRIRL